MHPKLRAGTPLKCKNCIKAFVKPDIVFFGERLPERYGDLLDEDLANCDLMIVMGTSAGVLPIGDIPDQVREECPRILINREPVGTFKRGRGKANDAFFVSFDFLTNRNLILSVAQLMTVP